MSIGLDVLISIATALFTIGGSVLAVVKSRTRMEMKLEQLAELLAKKEHDCEQWREACMGRRKDEHNCMRDDFKDIRQELRSLGAAVALQTAELGRTNQQLIDLVNLWKNGNGHK